MKKLATLFAIIACIAVFNMQEANSNNGGQKVTICHNGHEITISVNALDKHLAHGDSYRCSTDDLGGRGNGGGNDDDGNGDLDDISII